MRLLRKSASRFVILVRILILTTRKFVAVEGPQRAAAFAYYAFFSLFPLVVLFVTLGSFFASPEIAARRVLGFFESFAPVETGMQHQVFETIVRVVKMRARFGIVASAVLIWGSLHFFKALIRATNLAWGAPMHNWWRAPLKSLLLLIVMGSTLAVGIAVSVFSRAIRHALPISDNMAAGLYAAGLSIASILILFYGLTLFYKLTPRRVTTFSEVWIGGLAAAILLRLLGTVFVYYLSNFSQLNALYGTFGGIMALLLWIYFSGCIVVLGACLSAAQAELHPRAGKRARSKVRPLPSGKGAGERV